MMTNKTALDIPQSMWSQYHPFNLKSESLLSSQVSEARGVAHKIAEELITRFKAKKVVIFGSLARGDFGSQSDIDLAAWGIPPTDYFRAVAFATRFASTWKIDLIDADDCSASLREVIMREGVEA